MTEACHLQIARHAAPAWSRIPVPVVFYTDEAQVPKDGNQIVLLDTPDVADALGYHSETPGGRVYGKVFVKPVLDAGGAILVGAEAVSVTLSHEVVEQFVDPDLNLWADDDQGTLYAIEACDPVEGDAYGIKVEDHLVSVSNFVFPEWFDRQNPRSTRFDQMGLLKKPFTQRPGGYVVVRDKKGEHEVFAATYPEWKKAGKGHIAARTARRQRRA